MTHPAELPPTRPRRRIWLYLALAALVWGGSMLLAVKATYFYQEKRTPILRRLGLFPLEGVWQTNLYAVAWQRVPIFEDGRYGAIDPLAGGVLYSTRSGRLFWADTARQLRELALRVPINAAEFDADPYNASTGEKDIFAVKDLLVQEIPTGVRIFAVHHQWDATAQCNWLRVSSVATTLDQLLDGGTPEWSTLYDTRPCLPLGDAGGGRHVPTIGAGGRLVAVSDSTALLSVGTFVSDARSFEDTLLYANPAYDYGRVLELHLRTGEARPFTSGHRNPQGLARDAAGQVWSTEHLARGGDELNLLRRGADYGYPFVSLGTMYGMAEWPIHPERTGRHEGFEKPVYAWVPSIGPSQLIALSGRTFPRWERDLLVSSLAARSLLRVRVEEGRVVFVEPIPTGHRARDLVETSRGEVVVLAEDRFLVYLTPAERRTANASSDPLVRGQVVASKCAGCHALDRTTPPGIAPTLAGVVGRGVASVPGFTYSNALRELGGRWSPESLGRFIANPAAVAPGTTMAKTYELSEAEIGDLIAYLRTLR